MALPRSTAVDAPSPGAPVGDSLRAKSGVVDALLARLGPRLRRGGAPAERRPRCPTGDTTLDALLDGGFPRGRLSEVAGPRSSGRTSLALSLLAAGARGNEIVALVDAADALDPASAEAAGVALSRVLWVRAPDAARAIRCAERLLETRGLPLVVLDLALAGPAPRVAPAAWARLARAAAAGDAALVLLANERLAGPSAECALDLEPLPPRFAGTPALFEGIETRAVLVRSREMPEGRTARVMLRA